MPIKAPFLPYDNLRKVADGFLAEYHPEKTVPVPIEKIVEYQFGIDIVPVPGLQDGFDVESYLTSDLQEIHIDEWVYKKRRGRYLFSLAHELSHRLVHQEVFAQLKVGSIAEWKAAVRSIPEREYFFIEQQAYNLAGLILVPEGLLKQRFDAIRADMERAGLSLDSGSPDLWERVIAWLAREFDVSKDVISRRGPKDNLWAS